MEENVIIGLISVAATCMLLIVLGLEVMLVSMERKINEKLDRLLQK